MRARLLISMLVACGAKASQPAPIDNTAKPAATETANDGPGSARVVQRMATYGVIELTGNRGPAMAQAHQEMGAHCGPATYKIVKDGEEPVGGGPATVWRVRYECTK